MYRRCETEGVGISVMKAFSGGQLLDAKTSPFGRALTEYQCIQYALDKPGVLTILPGVRSMWTRLQGCRKLQIILTVEENVNIRKNVINTVADNGRKENNEVYKFRKIRFESIPHLYGVYGIWRCGYRTA